MSAAGSSSVVEGRSDETAGEAVVVAVDVAVVDEMSAVLGEIPEDILGAIPADVAELESSVVEDVAAADESGGAVESGEDVEDD